MALDTLFVFLDEGGNFDFSPSGSKYFTLTSVATTRPFVFATPLIDIRCSQLELGFDLEYFHASEDQQVVRDAVFGVISAHMASMRFDSVVVRKNRTAPKFQSTEALYPMMLRYLLQYVMRGFAGKHDKVVVVTDSIPQEKKKRAIEKSIKTELSTALAGATPYHIFHHASKSSVGLQIADYVNWAVFRKWERGDDRSYNIISPSLQSEFDIFKNGVKDWY